MAASNRNIEWIVWYVDGSSFTSEDGPPYTAPRQYVACISVASKACGRYVLGEQNFYCWHDDQWVPHDTNGLWQYLADRSVKTPVVLQGYWQDREAYFRIRSEALKRDTRLPKVTARGPALPEGLDS